MTAGPKSLGASLTVEARFAQMKHLAGLSRLRLCGVAGVCEQVLLAVAALNLRSLVKLYPGLPA